MGHSITDEAGRRSEYSLKSRGVIENPNSDGRNVEWPPRKSLPAEIAQTAKEIFFPDDPLRPCKGQPRSKQLLLFLRYLFPIFEWSRGYNLTKFKGDAIAGLTIASLCIPQDIAYAKLANLEPQYALCKYTALLTTTIDGTS
ncbi:sulfate transporter 1.2-like [Zingiber officinale]|uniref:sulfate transporter 1.2-like n=1 Tax=Zingiber officinale TaxID=94328 RepID=UPI001C4D1E2D|nr:sulfate transporter 1.2-like [Zingiber officinale]